MNNILNGLIVLVVAVLVGGAIVFPTPGCSSTTASGLPTCQSQTEVDKKVMASMVTTFDLRIATDTCIEDRDHVYGDGTYATLDCKGDGGTIRVEVPRKEWLDIKRDGVGSTNPGPGK